MRRALLLLFLGAACTQFPELDGTVAPDVADREPPRLLPLDQLQGLQPVPRDAAPIAAGMLARVAALNARAAQLRGPVIDRRTRRRLVRGVTAPNYAE